MAAPGARASKIPAFVVAGTSSGAGKTLVTLGVMEALRRRGLSVAPFKAGPDYIDPGLHARLLGRPSYNLDTWMMSAEGCRRTFAAAASGAGCAVVEGVMGLFDGRGSGSEEGSTAHLAKTLGLPVLLVADAVGSATSMGAVIKGFETFDKRVDLRWVVFNRVGSARHGQILRDAVKGSRVKVLGCVQKDQSLALEGRHLGLTTAADVGGARWDAFIKHAGDAIESSLSVGALLRSARTEVAPVPARSTPPATVRVAYALDRAFSFYYQQNLDILSGLGAQLVPFSPLADRALPPGTRAIYLGGGYPELHMKALEDNRVLRDEIRRAAERGMPIYAECGGLMYLGKSIEHEGRVARMTGVFPWATRLLARRKALGYRELTFTKGCPFVTRGRMRGHEFHYSELTGDAVATAYRVKGQPPVHEGFVYKNTLASYIHLHFASNEAFARGILGAAMAYDVESR